MIVIYILHFIGIWLIYPTILELIHLVLPEFINTLSSYMSYMPVCIEGGDVSTFEISSESGVLTHLESRRYDPARDTFNEVESSSSNPPVQQNIEPVQASAGENKNTQLGQGSNSVQRSAMLTLPIQEEQLTEEHKEFARHYRDTYAQHQALQISIHKTKWKMFDPHHYVDIPKTNLEREELWKQVLDLRAYAKENYGLPLVKDINNLVRIVTGYRA